MQRLEALATLFAYPGEDYTERVAASARQLDSDELRAFEAAIAPLPLTAQQEMYVQIFDLNPACTLEIGWHLFGEHYERGALLVELRWQLRKAGIAECGELPDHLVHVLPLLARMTAVEASGFRSTRLDPALEKIEAAIPEGNPFRSLIRATRTSVAGLVQATAGA